MVRKNASMYCHTMCGPLVPIFINHTAHIQDMLNAEDLLIAGKAYTPVLFNVWLTYFQIGIKK